jgi:hypothetical protein
MGKRVERRRWMQDAQILQMISIIVEVRRWAGLTVVAA